MNIKRIITGAVIVLVATAVFFFISTKKARKQNYSGGDFVLHSKQGNVALSDYRGKVVILYFGYTSCPDICPTNLSLIGSAFRKLSETERQKVAGIFVSVDPDRDTPSLIWEYARQFDPQIIGITGSEREVEAAARLYGVRYQKTKVDSALGYVVDHSASSYLIDREGRLVKALEHATPADEILQNLRELLK